MRTKFLIASAAVLLLFELTTVAQNQRLAFEVVSVKPVNAIPIGGQRGPGGVPAGVYDIQNHRFTAKAVTLYMLIKWSYGITAKASSCIFSECDFLTGGPSWVRSDQFDVQALMPDDSPIYTFAQMRDGRAPALQAMLQTMLADRFRLTLHREMKRMPVYVLTIAKGAPKLTTSKDDEKPALAVNGNPAVPTGDRVLFGRKASMAQLTLVLGLPAVTDRPVLDRTGLTGEFTFEAKFAPVDNNGVNNTSSPSIFTALQEQLGLKLEAADAPVEVLVIDHAEKPGEN